MIFANIEYLFLLVLLIPYIIWYVMKRKKTEPTLQVSTTRMYMKAPKSWKIYLLHAPFVLRTVAIIMVILILARPQTTDNWQNTEIEGIDIMLAVDVSTSMLAEDLKPNRLEAAKQVASEFINGRPNDNIGLTIFAGESFTQCPLTVDHGVLLNLFNSIKGDIAQRGLIEDGTAIGMGIANAVTRLKDSKAKSKVIILLTDGSNNRGDISPVCLSPDRLPSTWNCWWHGNNFRSLYLQSRSKSFRLSRRGHSHIASLRRSASDKGQFRLYRHRWCRS